MQHSEPKSQALQRGWLAFGGAPGRSGAQAPSYAGDLMLFKVHVQRGLASPTVYFTKKEKREGFCKCLSLAFSQDYNALSNLNCAL